MAASLEFTPPSPSKSPLIPSTLILNLPEYPVPSTVAVMVAFP